MPWIQTYTSKQFWYDNIEKSEIDILDIAHGLSNLCRYVGQCNNHYSVAQHSVLVSELVSEKNTLQGLMHDAAEAYMGDIPSPLKQKLPEAQKLEKRILEVIFKQFGVPFPISNEVDYYDHALCLAEREVLFGEVLPWGWEDQYVIPTIEIVPWSSMKARALFLAKFYNLQK